jgi:hypothetical protein
MKTSRIILLGVLSIFLVSCASAIKFPVSAVTPAADIKVSKKQDKNNNYRITVTAKNLAAPERLNPPKSVYVVWILTETQSIRNIGQLLNKNVKTASLQTITPFQCTDIFITAEDGSDILYPAGIEITRIQLN